MLRALCSLVNINITPFQENFTILVEKRQIKGEMKIE